MANDAIYVANTTMGIIILNAKRYDATGRHIGGQMWILEPGILGQKVSREDWDYIKNLTVVQALIETGKILPDKKSPKMEQETRATNDPVTPDELKEYSAGNASECGKEVDTGKGRRIKVKGGIV